jgi:predicted ATPase/transcriptional regulator with XRE-family HTH domain
LGIIKGYKTDTFDEGLLKELSFGEWLRRQRMGKGMTREQLANQIGCAIITLRKIESEERRPSGQIVERIAEIFNIPTNERKKFQSFSRGDWVKAPSEERGEAPWQKHTQTPHTNLPASLTSLIGRGQELATISDYLSNPSVRLVTLIGSPGIGKTSLGLQTARAALSSFANGVFFVALAPLKDPGLIALTVVQTLGFVETADQVPLEHLKQGIGDKQMLIVLDNVEHLIERTATLISDLLSACPRLKILTTSREALRIPGEWQYFVSPLSIPEEVSSIDIATISQFSALMMFAERARAVRPDFALNADNIQTVATICTRLDGLPLAIELIAARIRWMSPGSLLSQMTDQFVLSADGMRAVSARQKTLNDAIGWSYNLLSVKEQTLLRRLAIFSGGWTLQAAQAVCSGKDIAAREIPALLMQLLNKSLVSVRAQEHGERYQILEVIRQYAQKKLVEAHEEEQVRYHHLDFYMKLAEKGEQKVIGAEQAVWLERLESEMNNFRTGLRWGIENRPGAGFRLVSALWLFLFIHSHFIEGRQWYDKALSLAGKASPLLRIRLLNGAASNAMGRGDFEQTKVFSDQGLALAREHANQRGIALALHHLGIAKTKQGDYKRAQALLEEGLVISRESGNWATADYILSDLGSLSQIQDNDEKASAYYEEALELDRKHGDKWMSSYGCGNLASLAYRRDDYSQAEAFTKQAIKLACEFGDRRHISYLMGQMGIIVLVRGKPEKAVRLISAAGALAESVGIVFDPEDRIEHDQAIAAIKAQLGEAAFEALQAEGRMMTMDQAIEFALQENDE